MAAIYRLPIAQTPSTPGLEVVAPAGRPAEIHAFTGLNFTDMRRIMEKHGFCTEGLPGAYKVAEAAGKK